MSNINGGQWPPLRARIISTLRFFDLQDYPLTLLELHKFLISDVESLKNSLDNYGEIKGLEMATPLTEVYIDQILNVLEHECHQEIQNHLGFYYLSGRESIVSQRLSNYYYGIQREKLIRRYLGGLKYLPFVRGVAIAGSQAMGQEKPNSDIDLFIITDPQFLWLARTLVTAYFQILGKRRHGQNIANRFCLNHYLAGPKKILQLRNLYTASEYLKLRPVLYPHPIWSFQLENMDWIKIFFPNGEIKQPQKSEQAALQGFLETMLTGKFGLWLERSLKNWQLPKIRQEKFIVVEEDELSFHPDSKQQNLLADFSKLQKQN